MKKSKTKRGNRQICIAKNPDDAIWILGKIKKAGYKKMVGIILKS